MNKKGFTLIEVIIAICILGVLAIVLIPACVKYVETSKTSVCRSNIMQMYSLIRVHRNVDFTCNVSRVFEGNCTELSEAFEEYHCPTGSKYYEENGYICCPVHGIDGGGNLGSGGDTPGGNPDEGGGSDNPDSGSKVPGTDLPLRGSGWPTEDMFDERGRYYFKEGEIFEHEGEFFVITKDYEIYINKAAGGPNEVLDWDFFEKFSGKIYDSSSEQVASQLKDVVHGDLYVDDDGTYYVYMPNGGGHGPMPPPNFTTEWYKVPKG